MVWAAVDVFVTDDQQVGLKRGERVWLPIKGCEEDLQTGGAARGEDQK